VLFIFLKFVDVFVCVFNGISQLRYFENSILLMRSE